MAARVFGKRLRSNSSTEIICATTRDTLIEAARVVIGVCIMLRAWIVAVRLETLKAAYPVTVGVEAVEHGLVHLQFGTRALLQTEGTKGALELLREVVRSQIGPAGGRGAWKQRYAAHTSPSCR
jgi:hypothetical protein